MPFLPIENPILNFFMCSIHSPTISIKRSLPHSLHCVKSVRIWSYSGPYFPAFRLNTDQNNSEYGHFLRSHLSLA